MINEKGLLGYVKYDAEYIKDGIFDARKSANALFGFDEMMRYFILKECPELKDVNFDFPVKIEKGSWEIVIPENINDLIILSSGIIMTTYLASLAKKSASDGVFETGPIKDFNKIVKYSIKAIQWIARIAKQRKQLAEKEIEGAKPNINDRTVEIPSLDDSKNILIVPVEFLQEYLICPSNILSKLVSVVDEKTELEIGVIDEGEDKFMKTKITNDDRFIFYDEKEIDEIILPELEDGQHVVLEGQITRGNEQGNSLGFLYNDHVLTCKPKEGKITKYKNSIISNSAKHLFPRVKITGVIERRTESGVFKEKKPRIIFENIETIEKKEKDRQVSLNDYMGKQRKIEKNKKV